MPKFVFRDICVYYGGLDLSGELSSLNLEYTAETPDATTLRDTTRRRLPGLISVSSTHNGWYDSTSVDASLFAQVGANPLLMSAAVAGAAQGEVSFSWQALTAEYSPGATVGEVFAYTFNTMGDSPLARGVVMENGTFTVTTNGTARQVGAAAATDTIYSSVHVIAASGTTPTLDVTVESDDAMGFGTPVTRLTHPQFTTVGANQQTLAGPVTDDWWRLVLTIGGGSPSFTVFGAIAIQPTIPA